MILILKFNLHFHSNLHSNLNAWLSYKNVPKYIGFGTPEDSLASCKNLVPREPRKNIVQYIINANKYLRFGCVLDSARLEDQERQFILKYSLADGKISIHELSIINSGIQGGKFLSPQLIAKNDCYSSEPDYYTCKDFYIGKFNSTWIIIIKNWN